MPHLKALILDPNTTYLNLHRKIHSPHPACLPFIVLYADGRLDSMAIGNPEESVKVRLSFGNLSLVYYLL
jgi:hypothetical protein